MLLTVKEKLKNIQSEKNIDTRNGVIRQMLRSIDRDLNNMEKWKVFDENFDEVHEDFMNRFKEKHANITAKDMRLCALLRMNLSSKEIAPLLRISIRSVEISRYRLRKKIDLPHDINLTDYIVHF
jgi:AraC family chitin signaling transcriptional activator